MFANSIGVEPAFVFLLTSLAKLVSYLYCHCIGNAVIFVSIDRRMKCACAASSRVEVYGGGCA